jgi:hypothetical protein
MDIGKKVTVTYQLKRGNYAVDSDDRNNVDDCYHLTSECNCTSDIKGTESSNDGTKAEASLCDEHIDYKGVGDRLLASNSVQGISLPTRGEEQAFVSNWGLATNVGTSRLVSVQTSNGSTRICSTSIRIMVRSTQVPSRKELVLNEPA